MKITEREVQELIDNIDNDDNTSINYTEFIASTIDLGKVLTEDKIRALFNCFDVEHKGQITAEGIKVAFTKFGREVSDEDI
jgi:Ca2+-binding EF-hand superfamily protein